MSFFQDVTRCRPRSTTWRASSPSRTWLTRLSFAANVASFSKINILFFFRITQSVSVFLMFPSEVRHLSILIQNHNEKRKLPSIKSEWLLNYIKMDDYSIVPTHLRCNRAQMYVSKTSYSNNSNCLKNIVNTSHLNLN